MHTPALKQRNATNPFERDARQWTCNECPYILRKVLTPNLASTRHAAPTLVPAMIMIRNGIALKVFICVSHDRKLFYFCFLLLLIFCYCYCYLFIIVFFLFIVIICLLEVALALRQLNPIHKKGPSSFLSFICIFCLSCLVFDMCLPTATYFINLVFSFLLCFLFVYLN